jgi:prevent-host-death family protein
MVMYNDQQGGNMPVTRVNIAEAKARFSELVRKAVSGDEIIIARDNKPLLALVPLRAPRQSRKPGSARGKVWLAPDFDETPDDFTEYCR